MVNQAFLRRLAQEFDVAKQSGPSCEARVWGVKGSFSSLFSIHWDILG